MGKPDDSIKEKRKLGERLKTFVHGGWGQLIRDIIIAIAAAIIGYVIPIQIQAYHRKPFAKMWTVLLHDQTKVPIVIADVPAQEFSIPRYHTKSRLPENVPLLGLQDALGVSALTNALSDAGWISELHATEDSRVQMNQSTFVSIGGPSVNEATYELVASCEEVANGGRGKMILHSGTVLDSKLIIYYPSHEAEDMSGSVPSPFVATRTNSRLNEDYGFIEIGLSKYAKGQNVIVAFGLWPPGTQAAVEALIHPDTTSDLGKRMQLMIKNKEPMVAVVKTTITSISSQVTPVLVAVRPLDSTSNPSVADQPCTTPSKRIH